MQRNRLAVMLLGMHAVGGCAREALPPEVPGMPVAARTEAEGAQPDATHAGVLPTVRRRAIRGTRSLAIPEGEACLAWLQDLGVAFRSLDPKPGMRTPVAVTGPIGGVRYETAGSAPLVCDCRLVVALDWVAPELHTLGVTEVRHSGAYVYRTQKNGRASLHAEGLAIDVHELSGRSQRLDVFRDYVRGAGPSCAADSPALNHLACELDRTGLFEEVITPDDDSDHRDHLHLAIAPL